MMDKVFGSVKTCTLHNVRLSKSAKVLYPYHPLFDTELEIFGGAGGQRDVIYVKLPNHATRGVPAWMFDEVICSSVRTAEQPTIDGDALLRLAQLLDAAQENLRTKGDETNTLCPTKPTSACAAVATESAVGVGGAKPTDPGCQSSEVRPVVSPTAGKRCSPEKIPARRQP
jgi:hypothetical protein